MTVYTEHKYMYFYMYIYIPGTLNNQFLMDGNCETTISQDKVWNHPTEPAILIRGCFGYQVYTVIYIYLYIYIMCMDIYIYSPYQP